MDLFSAVLFGIAFVKVKDRISYVIRINLNNRKPFMFFKDSFYICQEFPESLIQ